MLILILITILISIVCLVWGNIFLDFACRILQEKALIKEFSFSFICLAGLSVLGLVAMVLSLLVPIDWKTQLFLLIPVLFYLFFRSGRKKLAGQVESCFINISLPGYLFLLSCLLIVFVISSFSISHPDTLAYHAQAIRWMERYPATPGIVHLRKELGLQSLWFGLEALFNFDKSGGPMIFYTGPAVLCWFLIFMAQKIGGPLILKENSMIQRQAANPLAMLVLGYTFISWTQIRLTAASASPDFINSIFILATFYLFCDSSVSQTKRPVTLAMVMLFCVTAINIKLSAIPLILLPILIIHSIIQKKQARLSAYFTGFFILFLVPLLIRNYIATGYPLFPSNSFNFFSPDWKYDERSLVHFQHYITAYARFPVVSTNSEESYLQPMGEWIPIWWRNLTVVDKGLFLAVFFSFVFDIFFLKSLMKKVNGNWVLSMAILTAGFFLWFLRAPDPRFGSGWMIALVCFLLLPWQNAMNKINNKLWKGTLAFGLFLFFCGNLIYASHRLIHFWMPGQLISPLGLNHVNTHEIPCGELKIYLVNDGGSGCGSSSLPCATDSCRSYQPRGETIEAGFSARK